MECCSTSVAVVVAAVVVVCMAGTSRVLLEVQVGLAEVQVDYLESFDLE